MDPLFAPLTLILNQIPLMKNLEETKFINSLFIKLVELLPIRQMPGWAMST